MSQDTLDIYNTHRQEQVENGTFSETFQIVGGSTFNGVFDRSQFNENKDSGHVEQNRVFPRILVDTIPSGITERQTQITRENGVDTFTFMSAGVDAEGIPVLWLF